MTSTAERFAWTSDQGITITRSTKPDDDPTVFEDKSGVKKVRDADYWGAPVGTPIVAGMRAAHREGGAAGVRKFLRTQGKPKKTASSRSAGRTGGSGRRTAAKPTTVSTGRTQRPAADRARAIQDAWGDRIEPGSRDFRRRGASNREYTEAYVSKAELTKAREIAIERARTKAPKPEKSTVARNKWIIKEFGGPGTGAGDIRGNSHDRSRRSWAVYVAFGGFNVKTGKDKGYVPCLGCGAKMSWHDNASFSKFPKFEQDKIITTGDGGSYNPQNLMPLCAACNNKRGSKKLWDIPAFGKQSKPSWYNDKFADMVKRTRASEKAKAIRPRGEFPEVAMPVPPGHPGRVRAVKGDALDRSERFWDVSDTEGTEDQGQPSTGDRVTAHLWNYDGRHNDVEAGVYPPDVEDAEKTIVGTLYVEEVDSLFGKYTRHVIVGDNGEVRHIEEESIELVAKSPDYRDRQLFTKTRSRALGVELDLEEKRGLRRVRTAEGVEKYGMPIGSIIGSAPRPPKGRGKGKSTKPKINDMRGGKRRISGKNGKVKKPTASEIKSFEKWVLDDLGVPKKNLDDFKNGVKDSRGVVDLYMPRAGATISIVDRPGETIGIINIQTGSQDPQTVELSLGGRDRDLAWEVLAVALHRIEKRNNGEGDDYDEDGFWPANRSPREYDALPEYWGGVRGVDWSEEGDDTRPTDEARRSLIEKEAADLGFKWDTTPGGAYRQYHANEDVGLWAKETANAVMRSHEEQFPGFAKLHASIISGKHRRAIAWNGLGVGDGNDVNGKWRRAQVTIVGLNPDWFGEDYDNPTNNMRVSRSRQASKRDGKLYRWHSIDYEDLSGTMGVDKYDAQLIGTLTHELGHTVGNILQGNMVRDGDFANYVRGVDLDNDEATVSTFFRGQLLDLLYEFGILKETVSAKELDTPLTFQSAANKDLMPLGAIDTEALAYHVSVYGSTNFAEMFAETWAAYQLDSNPTQFVRELGALMEDALNMYLDEETGARAQFKTFTATGGLEIS